MSQSSKEIILETTAKLLLKSGYNAFSFADISKEVGLAKATIHHHFASKEELVVEVLMKYRAAASGGYQHVSKSKTNAHARLEAYAKYWQSCIESDSQSFCICALLAAELPSLPELVRAQVSLFFKELVDWLTGVFDEGQKLGTLTISGSAKAEAALFRAAIHGAMLSARASGDKKDFETSASLALNKVKPLK